VSKFRSLALKKKVNPLSHFRAARATSITWLRFAPCTMRIKARINSFSPLDKFVHHRSVIPLIVFIFPPRYRTHRDIHGATPKDFPEKLFTGAPSPLWGEGPG
jgi:hypothetical protein